MYRTLILSDIHVPYHDKKAHAKVLAFAQDMGITDLYLNGDTSDQYAVSRFNRDPERSTFKKEAACVRDYLDSWECVQSLERKTWTDGNHEVRVSRYVKKNAPELGFLVEPDGPLYSNALYGLTERGFDYYPYMVKCQLPNLPFILVHGEAYGLRVGVNSLKRFGSSGSSGHSHRQSLVVASKGGGELWSCKGGDGLHLPSITIDLSKYLVWLESGHMCDVKQADYLVGENVNWQQGGIVIEYEKRGTMATITPFRTEDL